MYCTNCGKEIAEGSVFCQYCGFQQAGQTTQYVQPGIEGSMYYPRARKPFYQNKKFYIIGAIALILLLGVSAIVYGMKPSISDEYLSELISDYGYNSYMINGEEYAAKIQSLENVKQNWNRSKEEMTVKFDMYMENDFISVVKECEAVMYKEVDNNWAFLSFDNEVKEMIPKQGVEADEYALRETVTSQYPTIKWDYTEQRFLKTDIDYCFPVDINIYSQDTDLKNKKDTITYSYQFSTYTASFSGVITETYEFDNELGWISVSVEHNPYDMEWNITGLWKFDIATYYLEINIYAVDWNNDYALMEVKGSVFEGGGEVLIYQVPFYIEDGYIYFDTISIRENYYTRDVTLLADYTDMSYERWNESTPIGGKTSMQ